MRNFLSLALACLLAISSSAIAEAKDDRPRKVRLPVHSRTTAYAVQTVSVRTGCFSPRLEGILAHIAVKTGRRPLVTSGHRPRSHRSGSMHRFCQAADIRVSGISDSAIIAAAKTAPGIGGIGRYCNGIIHVDTGPKRQWAYCGKSKRHFLSAKRRSGKRA
ncbi:YcbK family protein [Pararhizobium sp. PWRC1-1]|uniref:YcbK family protein n=1 Tax=Pararhizobium sp. PWRC1-1 TaxID=2804566 RepID=UPI003CF3588A